MDIHYKWEFTIPADSLHVTIKNFKNEDEIFRAELLMKRREITGPYLCRMLIRYPFMNIKIISAIYWQAIRLKLKGASFYTHPGRLKPPPR